MDFNITWNLFDVAALFFLIVTGYHRFKDHKHEEITSDIAFFSCLILSYLYDLKQHLIPH